MHFAGRQRGLRCQTVLTGTSRARFFAVKLETVMTNQVRTAGDEGATVTPGVFADEVNNPGAVSTYILVMLLEIPQRLSRVRGQTCWPAVHHCIRAAIIAEQPEFEE